MMSKKETAGEKFPEGLGIAVPLGWTAKTSVHAMRPQSHR